jgi:RNA polymerase sigma factor (sigma-70 family)
MEQLVKFVRTYRLTAGIAERVRLSDEIFLRLEPQLRFFVFGQVPPPDAEDVLQEIMKAVATSLGNFKGNSRDEFMGWCYSIARHKLNDHYRRKAGDRMQPLPPEELWPIVDATAQKTPMSAGDRIDLEDAMKLLTASKPECYDFLWKHYVIGLDYAEIAEEQNLKYDNVRMKIGRCLDVAQSLVS